MEQAGIVHLQEGFLEENGAWQEHRGHFFHFQHSAFMGYRYFEIGTSYIGLYSLPLIFSFLLWISFVPISITKKKSPQTYELGITGLPETKKQKQNKQNLRTSSSNKYFFPNYKKHKGDGSWHRVYDFSSVSQSSCCSWYIHIQGRKEEEREKRHRDCPFYKKHNAFPIISHHSRPPIISSARFG